MVVPSMTLSEIRKEVFKELPIIERKAFYVTRQEYKYKKHSKNKDFVKYYDYYSKYKNTWICGISHRDEKAYSQHMLYFYGKTGLAAVTIDTTQEQLQYYTAHFFNRYNERLQLNLVQPHDILLHFIQHNTHISYTKMDKVREHVFKMYGVTQMGMIAGIQNFELKLLKVNTFLSPDMLSHKQQGIAEYLSPILEKYVADSEKL